MKGICKLDFCPYNFLIFQFLRSGKGEIDVYCFMFNRYLLFCHDPLSHLAIDALSCMKF